MSAAKNSAVSAYQDTGISIVNQCLKEDTARRFAEQVAAILLRMQAGILVDPVLGPTRTIVEALEKAYHATSGRQAPPALRAHTAYDGERLVIGGVVLGRNVPALSYKPTKIFKLDPMDSWLGPLTQALERLEHAPKAPQPPIFPLP